jgi:hypothetical protein
VRKPRKRIAAAVLAACVNVLGAAKVNALVTPADADDDGPDGVETIEFGKAVEQARHASGSLLAAASAAASGDPIDAGWISRAASGAWAAVTVEHRSPHIAYIDVTFGGAPGDGGASPPELTLNQLLGRALKFCGDRGVLKVVLQPDGLPIGSLCRFAESRGFQFSRVRSIDGLDHLEFYRDLYRRTAGAA